MADLHLGALDERAIVPWARSIKAVVGKDVELDTLRERAAVSGSWTDHGVNFGVWRGDEPVGLVQAMHCERWGVLGNHEVGVLVFDPGQRGRGVGSQALTLLLDHLFVQRQAFRVWFLTDAGNVAMQRVGERCGFRREGLVRGSVEIDGVLHDDLLYGITRDDPRPSP